VQDRFGDPRLLSGGGASAAPRVSNAVIAAQRARAILMLTDVSNLRTAALADRSSVSFAAEPHAHRSIIPAASKNELSTTSQFADESISIASRHLLLTVCCGTARRRGWATGVRKPIEADLV
jgi:hypothetical protein